MTLSRISTFDAVGLPPPRGRLGPRARLNTHRFLYRSRSRRTRHERAVIHSPPHESFALVTEVAELSRTGGGLYETDVLE